MKKYFIGLVLICFSLILVAGGYTVPAPSQSTSTSTSTSTSASTVTNAQNTAGSPKVKKIVLPSSNKDAPKTAPAPATVVPKKVTPIKTSPTAATTKTTTTTPATTAVKPLIKPAGPALPLGGRLVEPDVVGFTIYACPKCKTEYSAGGKCKKDGTVLVKKTKSFSYICYICGYAQPVPGKCPTHKIDLKKNEILYMCAPDNFIQGEPGKCEKCGQVLKKNKIKVK